MQMQSLLVNPVGAYTNGSKLTRMAYPLGVNPRMGKRVNVGVKCMAEGKPEGEPKLDSTSSPKSNPTISSSSASKPKPRVNFHETIIFIHLIFNNYDIEII